MAKIGVIDVGGGTRDIYGAGVFDYCMDHDIRFDYCIGVSAGSANTGSYVSNQRGRNYRFFRNYCLRPRYMNAGNLLRTGNYLDDDYIYNDIALADGEDPYDFETAIRSGIPNLCVTMDARTGKPVYFRTEDMRQDDYFAFIASCNIPIMNRPYYVGDMPCYDGGGVNPLPIRKAFHDGCDKVVVILTLPVDRLLDPRKDQLWAAVMRPRFPRAADAIAMRSRRYNSQLALTKVYAQQGKVLIVAPYTVFGQKTLPKDPDILDKFYRMGYHDAEAIPAFME